MNKKRGVITIIITVILFAALYFVCCRIDSRNAGKDLILPDIHKGIQGLKDLKEISSEQTMIAGPLFYTSDGEPITVLKEETVFNYTNLKVENILTKCGHAQTREYLNSLVKSFSGSKMFVYSFSHLEEDFSYRAKLVENVKRYKDVEDFRDDFGICGLEEGFKIKKVSDSWLLFTDSCDYKNEKKKEDCLYLKDLLEYNFELNY
jgi:hypothetical protein